MIATLHRLLATLALAGLAAGTLATCGGTSSLADPAPCPTPLPLPTSAATPRVTQGRAYFTALQNALEQLQDRLQRFKLDHPNNRFSRDDVFRPSVAAFIDESTCTALATRALKAPTQQAQQSRERLDAALDDYVALLAAGRAAIKSRNVTDYRTFYDGLDPTFQAIRDAASQR